MIKRERKKELKSKDWQELKVEAGKLRSELVSKRLDLAMSKLKNVRLIKALKAEISLVLTLIREKELLAQAEEDRKEDKKGQL